MRLAECPALAAAAVGAVTTAGMIVPVSAFLIDPGITSATSVLATGRSSICSNSRRSGTGSGTGHVARETTWRPVAERLLVKAGGAAAEQAEATAPPP